MIKIEKKGDLNRIKHTDVYPYIKDLLEYLLTLHNTDCISDDIGAIFLIEQKSDLLLLSRELGLSPITESRFEWIDEIGQGYSSGVIVINNELAITIISKSEHIKEH